MRDVFVTSAFVTMQIIVFLRSKEDASSAKKDKFGSSPSPFVRSVLECSRSFSSSKAVVCC